MRKEPVALDTKHPIWDQFFTVAPLVLIGSREGETYDLAPKHMAMPLGWDNYFGFVCTPRHATYGNIKIHKSFTVSFPKPSQVVIASITASPRCNPEGDKPALGELETFPARTIDGIFIKDAYLFLECELERIIDGFGANSLICGRIIAAYADPDVLRHSSHEDQEQIFNNPQLVYLNPGRFAAIRESFAFPFPAKFEK